MSKIWILTEERPKRTVLNNILVYLHTKLGAEYKNEALRINPVFSNKKFAFRYDIEGVTSSISDDITIIPVSGKSSFVDFLVYVQDDEPVPTDIPVLVIEETKTDDAESRNTGVYQRSSKFVYSKFFYPDSEQLMLYNLRVAQKETPTKTYVFGTRMLVTSGIKVLGKRIDESIFTPFTSIDEMMELKNAMPAPGYGVAVRFTKQGDTISISAKLEKAGRLSHDPNIGMTSLMASCLRKLGWTGKIVITEHGLSSPRQVGHQNKFNFIAYKLGITLDGIELPEPTLPDAYWEVEKEKEKTASIFTHIICENLDYYREVYENHGGCERGYFYYYDDAKKAIPLAIPKYRDRAKYKEGNKEYIIYIPDLVMFDTKRNEVINIEGKTYANRANGVLELNNYDFFEDKYINNYFKDAKIVRGLTLSGTGNGKVALSIKEMSLYLDNEGNVFVSQSAPAIIQDAYSKLPL